MRALNVSQRRFALAAVQFPLAKDYQIARAAGYSDFSHGALRVTAHRLFHDEKILEAIKELADKELRSSALLGIATMKKIARLDGHKDQLKAATAILDRAGFGVEQTINVNKTVTRKVDVSEAALRIAEFRLKFPEQFAKLLGVPEPAVVDGEFSEVTE
jgi:phage terminase small subunit